MWEFGISSILNKVCKWANLHILSEFIFSSPYLMMIEVCGSEMIRKTKDVFSVERDLNSAERQDGRKHPHNME